MIEQIKDRLKKLQLEHSILYNKLQKNFSQDLINKGVILENKIFLLKTIIPVIEDNKTIPIYLSEPFKKHFPEFKF